MQDIRVNTGLIYQRECRLNMNDLSENSERKIIM